MSLSPSQSSSFQTKNVIIVHGYTASPQKNWFPWLKAELGSLGALVYVPEMPESSSPNPDKWQQYLTDLPIEIDENTLFIGHSLGCVTVLRFLEQQLTKQQKVGGYILVSGFDSEQETLPELASHTQDQLNYDVLINASDKRVSIISSNDEIVSPKSSKLLANSLKTEIVVEDNAGHFLDRDGYVEFPSLLKIIKEKF